MERSTHLHIDPYICQSCSPCSASRVCRLKAIVQVDYGEQPYLDGERCRDCRVCLPACPYGAVRKMNANGDL